MIFRGSAAKIEMIYNYWKIIKKMFNIRYSGTNLIKNIQYSYTKKNKILLKEFEEDPNKIYTHNVFSD